MSGVASIPDALTAEPTFTALPHGASRLGRVETQISYPVLGRSDMKKIFSRAKEREKVQGA